MNRFYIRPLGQDLPKIAFDCGQAELNDYLRCYARQDMKRHIARVFVATPEKDDSIIAGFYTLSAGSIHCTELPEMISKKYPKYPIPIALLGRLAVDAQFQGQGLGSILLADACQRIAHATEVLAVVGIVVDAKGAAEGFYRHFGFVPLQGTPNKLFLSAKVFTTLQN